MAGRARLRLHAGLRPGDGDPGAGGDRPAAAPQPRRHVVGGDEPAQAGRPVDGDDARDDRRRGCSRPGRAALRLARQGPGRPAAGARGRRPARRPVHHRLLVGIGETLAERAETIFALRGVARRYGARAGGHRPELPGQARHRDARTPTTSGWRSTVAAIAVTRLVLGPKVRVQAPPNLVDLAECAAAARAPASTTGAASRPLTPDHVNPERPWPRSTGLPRCHRRRRASSCAERLTVHPEYVRRRRALARPAAARRTSPRWPSRRRAGRRGARRPTGPAVAGARRRLATVRRAAPTCTPPSTPTGRTDDRRGDFDDVYGDWDGAARAHGRRPRRPTRDCARCRRPRGRARRCCGAETRPGAASPTSSALALMTAEGRLLDAVCRARRRPAPRRPSATTSPTSSTGTSTSPTSATSAAGSARSPSGAPTPTPTRCPSTRSPTAPRRRGQLGATEVCMQGGIDPELPGTAYFDLVRAVKQRRARHARARLLARWRSSTAPPAPACRSRTS